MLHLPYFMAAHRKAFLLGFESQDQDGKSLMLMTLAQKGAQQC